MKKVFLIVMLCFCGSIVFSQTALSDKLETTSSENDELEKSELLQPSLNQEELLIHISNWKNLRHLELSQYLEGFKSFLDISLSHYEMQPYVLAESFWFQLAILFQFQIIQQDGSLDKMQELNMTLLPEIKGILAEFYVSLGDGAVPVHPWSDAVLSFFKYLGQNPIAGNYSPILAVSNLPEIPSLNQEQPFMPVDATFRGNQLYRGLMAFQKLLKDFNDGQIQKKSTSEAIDLGVVLSNYPLMYVLRHVPSGRDAYSFLKSQYSGEILASQCEDAYLQCQALGEQWGFYLEQVLPPFSGAGVKAIGDDLFILYCLSSHDLEQICADLNCINTFGSVYFSRTVDLLRHVHSKQIVVESKNGGSF